MSGDSLHHLTLCSYHHTTVGWLQIVIPSLLGHFHGLRVHCLQLQAAILIPLVPKSVMPWQPADVVLSMEVMCELRSMLERVVTHMTAVLQLIKSKMAPVTMPVKPISTDMRNPKLPPRSSTVGQSGMYSSAASYYRESWLIVNFFHLGILSISIWERCNCTHISLSVFPSVVTSFERLSPVSSIPVTSWFER